jgi:hypothetical protein
MRGFDFEAATAKAAPTSQSIPPVAIHWPILHHQTSTQTQVPYFATSSSEQPPVSAAKLEYCSELKDTYSSPPVADLEVGALPPKKGVLGVWKGFSRKVRILCLLAVFLTLVAVATGVGVAVTKKHQQASESSSSSYSPGSPSIPSGVSRVVCRISICNNTVGGCTSGNTWGEDGNTYKRGDDVWISGLPLDAKPDYQCGTGDATSTLCSCSPYTG